MKKLPSSVTFFERGWLSSNSVLLQDERKSVLVDTGYWSHADQTIQLVKSSLKERTLDWIVNTHLHSDHCGGNARLQQSFPKVQTFIPPGMAAYVDNWDAVRLTYTPTGQFCPPFAKSDVLHNGNSFDIGGSLWRIHAAPGHDPHSMILFNEQDRTLISADALWENGFGVVFPEIEGFQAFEEVAFTLQVIEDLKPLLVLPGHGAMFTDVPSALARARSRLKQFRESPEKHASYAAKVLLKFRLLEIQKVSQRDFYSWATEASYLALLHKEYGASLSFKTWFEAQCLSLVKSKACRIDDGIIINI